MIRAHAIVVITGVLCVGTAGAADSGQVRLIKRTMPAFDRYTDAPSPELQDWMRQRFSRMVVFTPYFDNRSAWYGDGLVYLDAYAIYSDRPTGGENLPATRPGWIMRDPQGRPLYIPWGCQPDRNTCPQYAADFSNPDFRAWWIGRARAALAQGNYRGVWIDDVNMDWRVGDGFGNFVNPLDYNTGAPMTLDNWRRYMAEFMEQVRRELPGIEIAHNTLWFAGENQRLTNPYIRRQILAADLINLEHGINDDGLQPGAGRFGFRTFLSYVDGVHGLGRAVILDGIGGTDADTNAAVEYGAAGYLLLNGGNDFIADGLGHVTPDAWYPVLATNLGKDWKPWFAWQGLLRRDFERGMVLLNEPGAATLTVELGGTCYTSDGRAVTRVTLAPGRGAVLSYGP